MRPRRPVAWPLDAHFTALPVCPDCGRMVAPADWDRHRAGHKVPSPVPVPTEGDMTRAYEQHQRSTHPEEG